MSNQTGNAKHTLPSLPYADNALEPVISAKTLGFHYGKHHKTYVDNLNKLVAGTELAEKSLEEVITATAGQAKVRHFQQCGASLEPYILLEQSVSQGRWRAALFLEAENRSVVR